MLKKVLIVLGCVFVIVVSLIVGVNVYTGYKSAKYDEIAVPYIEAAIPEISKWDKNIFNSYLSSEAKEEIDQDRLAKILKIFKQMGTLVSYEKPEFDRTHSYVAGNGESRTLDIYNVNAKYENGDGVLTFTLIEKKQALELLHFNLQSMALVE